MNNKHIKQTITPATSVTPATSTTIAYNVSAPERGMTLSEYCRVVLNLRVCYSFIFENRQEEPYAVISEDRGDSKITTEVASVRLQNTHSIPLNDWAQTESISQDNTYIHESVYIPVIVK